MSTAVPSTQRPAARSTTLARWATPLTAGSFLLSAVTGVLAFFHFTPGFVRWAHEWLSWLMIAAVLFHLAMHWRSFARYFSQKPALLLMGLCTAVTLASMLPLPGSSKGPNPRAVSRQLMELASHSELRELAALQDMGANELVEQLRSQGLDVKDASQTVEEVARHNGTEALTVIARLL